VDNQTIDHLVHNSIFELSFAQLDRKFFWLVFGGMLLFTIFVDQAENWAHRKAEERVSNQKFLTRVNAELMMFGCVGLFLFILGNVTDLPHDEQLVLEFVDILCSMGACGLIAIAAVLFAARSWDSRNYKRLEAANLIDKPIEPSGPAEINFFQKHISFKRLTDMDYQVMATRFIINNDLPKEFVYSDYLDETIVGNACDLMDIKVYTWLVLLVVVVIFFSIRLFRGELIFTNTVYITWFMVSNWLVFFGFSVLLYITNGAYAVLVREIREDEQVLQAAGIKMCPNAQVYFVRRESSIVRYTDSWTRRMKFGMQLVSLVNSFLCSFYVMHLQFNLQAANMAWWWRPLLLFPLLVSLFFMLPFLILRFTAAEAYFSPDGDALDISLHQLTELEEDLECIRRMWEAKGRPEFPSMSAEGCDEEGFSKVLRDLGIHIAKARIHRIFTALDEDKSGGVTTEELMQRLTNRLVAASESLSAPMGRTSSPRTFRNLPPEDS